MTEKLSIPMTPEMLKGIYRKADARQLSAAELVRRLIEECLGTETEKERAV
jgi:hypothetical protein